MSSIDRVVVVTKETALEGLLARYGSIDQVRFFLRSREREADFAEYKEAHDAQHRSVADVVRAIPHGMPQARATRSELSGFLFREKDLIIAIGPDGLFVNLAKYTTGQPILTINPDPKRIDGTLMRFASTQVKAAIAAIIEDRAKYEEIALARVDTNDGQHLYAVNELLIGRQVHTSALYTIQTPELGKLVERQSSSGIIVSTGTGSTGWLKSVVTGAQQITGAASRIQIPFARHVRQLVYAVREPFVTKYSFAVTVFGRIGEGQKLVVTSEMPEGGIICSDGVYEDAIAFTSGVVATITLADRRARLVTSI
jgi:hypothetical protein